jgi:hypothetical protein
MAAAAGCGGELDRQSLVSSLRLLAIVAEPPEPAPNESVAVSALWWAPEGPPPFFRWSHCAAPANGSIDACEGFETPIDDGSAVDEVSFTPVNSQELVRLTLCEGAFSSDCSGGDTVAGAKRVNVTTGDVRNANPVIESLTVTPRERDAVIEVVGSDDGEDGELFVSWFATAGEFEDDRSFGGPSFQVTWDQPAEDIEGVTIWAVLRDGRGGIAWDEATLTIR